MEGFCALSTMRDMRVLDRNGEFVGRINDAFVDVREGRIEYVCIALDASLSASQREAIVPWSTLTLTNTHNARWRIAAGKAALMHIAQPAASGRKRQL